MQSMEVALTETPFGRKCISKDGMCSSSHDFPTQ